MSSPLRTAQRVARALEQHRPHLLRGAVPGERLNLAALHNAQECLEDVWLAIADRGALQEDGTRRVLPLTPRETAELLQRQTVGRFAYVARAGVPDVVPVNYVWYDGAVLIRSGPGPKLQAAQRNDVVALEVDELDLEHRTGCSAVVVGPAEVVLPRQVPVEIETWAGGPHRHVIRIVPTRVTGRRLA